MKERHRVTPDWAGETCFIIGGGPSVLDHDLSLLEGQKVIVINTSYTVYPQADYLIFGDTRWWDHHRNKLGEFKGKVISVSSIAADPRLLRMNRSSPNDGLAKDTGTVALKTTTATAAMNLAVHLGVKKIILLGMDGDGRDGKSHHHAPHPWKHIPGGWHRQRDDLKRIAKELRHIGVECVNASPGSKIELWPIVELKDHLCSRSSAGTGGTNIPSSTSIDSPQASAEI